QGLGAAVLRLHVVTAEMLGAAVELEVLALDHPRHGAQPAELVLEAVGALERADEDPLLVRVVLFGTHAASSARFSELAHVLFGKPVPTPHQVRDRLFPGHALSAPD